MRLAPHPTTVPETRLTVGRVLVTTAQRSLCPP